MGFLRFLLTDFFSVSFISLICCCYTSYSQLLRHKLKKITTLNTCTFPSGAKIFMLILCPTFRLINFEKQI